jgi:D-alanyl-D-alanine carboxypeptidase-like protein
VPSRRRTSIRVRRRRTLVAFCGLLLLVFGVTRLVGSDAPSAARPGDPASSLDAPPVRSPSVKSPAAYLSWIPGGFPGGFRNTVELADARKIVVIDGDTRWLTSSAAADGTAVDQPEPPFAIPIDAFSVDPHEYAPFLPADLRDEVVGALRSGLGVLGERSAALRRLGVGGSLSFGDVDVEVGAIVPDDAIGWSELLVSRQVGKELGIEHERYLLALMGGSPTEDRFESMIASQLPPDTLIRVAAPGTTRFVRVASGVNPPLVLKEVFGEFSAHTRSDDPAFLTLDEAWTENIETRDVPLLGEVTCHHKLFPQLIGALTDVRDAGLGRLIHVYSGCWAPRTVARSPTAPPSTHAYGAAIDINAPENPFGAEPTMDRRIVRIFERWGFNWGGDFLIPDGMHFEYDGPPT